MGFRETIRKLREERGASQQDLADAIDVARATYAGLETGRRDPSLGEMTRLAEYYQIAPSELIDGRADRVEEPAVPYVFADKEDVAPLDFGQKINPEKLREVLFYVLQKVGAKPNVGEAVLHKLLYFIDFDYYEKTGRPITGLTYIRNHYGPVPAKEFAGVVGEMVLADELEITETKYFKNAQKKYLPRKPIKLNQLTADELQHIDATLARLSDKTNAELSEISLMDASWQSVK